MAIIDYFGKSVDMMIVNDLAVGKIDSDKYLIESIDGFLDVMSANECEEVYSVNPTEIIK